MKNVHKIEMPEKAQKPQKDTQKVPPPTQKVPLDTQKVPPPTQKVPPESPFLPNDSGNVNDENQFKCTDCYKFFTTKRSLTRHQECCKKISNSLECHKCHKVFESKPARSRHIGKCTYDNTQQVSTIINNNINNINNTNINNITNNISINNNNNYIVFNIYDTDPIEFKHDHLDNAEILNQIFDKETFSEAFQDYSYRIFDAPENRVIKKTNMRQNSSLVYDHSKLRWREALDTMLYYKFARGISSSALVLTDKNDVIIDQDYRETLQQIQIDCEVSPENANKDEYTRYSKDTKNSIHMLKSVVKDITE